VLKGVVPGINEDDKVLIWNSSITEWFDAETVIRAVAQISRIRDDVKLFIIGTEHPDLVASTGTGPVQRAINVANETGTYDRSVFFNVAWVPYEEVGGYLRESYIGVCAAYEGFETEIAYRTRYVDLFWAELPMVCTGGDVLAKEIEARGAGIVVPPGDIDAFAEAILSLLDDPDAYARCKRGMSAMRAEHSWERALAPLVRFCQSESIAKRKRSRVLPLLRRVIPYLIGSARQRRDVY
jgi:hypothetical protein